MRLDGADQDRQLPCCTAAGMASLSHWRDPRNLGQTPKDPNRPAAGQWEVYVQPFMRPGDRVRVSTVGGGEPRWRADGKELFYLALDGAMMSVDTRDPANAGAPRKLFDSRIWVNPVEDWPSRLEWTITGVRIRQRTARGIQNTATHRAFLCPARLPRDVASLSGSETACESQDQQDQQHQAK
jgi:hypothetical protein